MCALQRRISGGGNVAAAAGLADMVDEYHGLPSWGQRSSIDTQGVDHPWTDRMPDAGKRAVPKTLESREDSDNDHELHDSANSKSLGATFPCFAIGRQMKCMDNIQSEAPTDLPRSQLNVLSAVAPKTDSAAVDREILAKNWGCVAFACELAADPDS